MKVRWLPTRATLLLLALAIYAGGTLPKPQYTEVSESPARLRFGQSSALSDFDSDGLIDEAKLDASGSHKSVGIFLSGKRQLSFLHFDSIYVGHGSLLSQDVDNDGAPDLIWTDLLREDNVTVWLGDGTGVFEQVTSCEYGGAFTLGDTNLAAPAGPNPETAINFETNPPLDHTPIQKFADQTTSALTNQHPDRSGTSSPAWGQPTDRGPPLPIS